MTPPSPTQLAYLARSKGPHPRATCPECGRAIAVSSSFGDGHWSLLPHAVGEYVRGRRQQTCRGWRVSEDALIPTTKVQQ